MELKVPLTNKMNKNVLSSLLALETSLFLTVFVFAALFKTPVYYAHKIIIICSLVTLFWLGLTLNSVRISKEKVNPLYYFSFFVFLIVVLYIIKSVWFRSYLTITPEYSFFNGLSKNDTTYHVTLCEAIKNFGYPAILPSGLTLHRYHCFSHILLAIISKIFRLPCLISYNFLYPIVFFPLFVYLLFQAIGAVRAFLGKAKDFSFLDLVFSVFIIIGFLPVRYSTAISIWWHDIFISESYCVSLIFLLLYIVVADKIKNMKHGIQINYYVITPFFLILVTASKISTGVIFFIALAWIFVRIKGIRVSTALFATLFFGLLLLSLSFFIRDNEKKFTAMGVSWFHFIKNYVPHKYQISHVFFILFPSLILFLLSKGSDSYRDYSKTKISILAETAVIISCCSLLPGMVFKIVGGSAAYFFMPAMFISLLFLLCSDELQGRFFSNRKEIKILIFLLVFVLYGESFIKVNSPKHIIQQFQVGRRGTKAVVNSSFYETLNSINHETEGKKESYCLLISKNCRIFELYGPGYDGVVALTAYLGMPVVGVADKVDSVQIEKIKKHIIVLEKDTYKIIN